jgi:hypothetical protein
LSEGRVTSTTLRTTGSASIQVRFPRYAITCIPSSVTARSPFFSRAAFAPIMLFALKRSRVSPSNPRPNSFAEQSCHQSQRASRLGWPLQVRIPQNLSPDQPLSDQTRAIDSGESLTAPNVTNAAKETQSLAIISGQGFHLDWTVWKRYQSKSEKSDRYKQYGNDFFTPPEIEGSGP